MAKKIDYRIHELRAMMSWGNQRSMLRPGLQGLPVSIDDAERDFGPYIYDRMLNDAAVDGAIDQVKTAVLSDGWSLRTSHKPPTRYGEISGDFDPQAKADYERSKEITDWVKEQLDEVTPDFGNVLLNLLDGLVWGHKLVEIILEPRAGKYELVSLMPRPKQMYAWVVDEHMKVEGVYALNGGGAAPSTPEEKKIIPLAKFICFSVGGRDGDPRGRSQIRSAYTGWMIKQGVWVHYNRFLEKMAVPSVVGKLGPEAAQAENTETATVEDEDLAQSTPEEAMLAKLLDFANATAIVVEHEAEVNVIESKNHGEPFGAAFDLCDRQMHLAILSTTRSTLEAKHGSRADSDTAENTVIRIAKMLRRDLAETIKRQFLKPFVAVNFGQTDADRYCPSLAFAAEPQAEDRTDLMKAIADWKKAGLVHDSQIEELSAMVGMPIPDIKAMLQEKAEQREAAMRQQRLADSLNGLDE